MKASKCLILIALIVPTLGYTKNCELEPLEGSQLGEVKISILDSAKFQMIYGEEWQLMDGSKMHDNSYDDFKFFLKMDSHDDKKIQHFINGAQVDYLPISYYSEILDKNIIPDARGKHLRGTNYFNPSELTNHTAILNKISASKQNNNVHDASVANYHYNINNMKVGEYTHDYVKNHSHHLFSLGSNRTELTSSSHSVATKSPAVNSNWEYALKTGNEKINVGKSSVNIEASAHENAVKALNINYYMKTKRKCLKDSVHLSFSKTKELILKEIDHKINEINMFIEDFLQGR